MVDHQAQTFTDDQEAYNRAINEHLAYHVLPSSYLSTVKDWLEPIASNIATVVGRTEKLIKQSIKQPKSTTLVLGVQGTQGSGKSTCSDFLKLILEQRYDLRVAVLSIDDFYLTREERKNLSNTVHPLLQTRGVPGTHDVDLAINTLQRLKTLAREEQCALPSFDKSIDDRSPEQSWLTINGPIDVIILEGWCIGLSAEKESSLQRDVNDLESNEDSDGKWRSFANAKLQTQYAELFGLIDMQLVLRAPSFSCVHNWRLKQEQKLIAKVKKEQTLGIDHSNTRLMSESDIARFIAHYQRLTEHALESLPALSDWCLWLDEEQSIIKMTTSKKINMLKKLDNIHYLVVTDLDGTLLDHHTYSWDAAIPSLTFLKQNNIPVVINTSKTFQEVAQLQKHMNISDPFIVENGSALYVPLNFFTKNNILESDIAQLLKAEKLKLTKDENFYSIVFGQHRKNIVNAVYSLRTEVQYKFSGYSDWTIDELITHTGLDQENAKLSMERLYSEPMIWNDTEEALDDFSKKLKSHSLSLLKGGRFYHVLGNTNKAQPVLLLQKLLSLQHNENFKTIHVIALGDSPNDRDMLEIAEHPVWVKSPKASYPNHNCKASPYFTQGLGPKGWHEAIDRMFTT